MVEAGEILDLPADEKHVGDELIAELFVSGSRLVSDIVNIEG